MLDILVSKALAARTLREAHALAQRLVVGLAVRRVEGGDRVAAFDADGHDDNGRFMFPLSQCGVFWI